MILVILGTHPQPMDRLLRELDELIDRGEIREPVVVQGAALGYSPRRLQIVPVMPHQQLVKAIDDASVVIAHAGPGTLAAIRLRGKVPVVVPRARRHGEHVDDHQERYARGLAELEGYVVVIELSELARAIQRARNMVFTHVRPDLTRAIQALEEILAG